MADAIPDDDRQESDYDGAWKEAVRFHLREFIERYFPKLAVLIDWSREPHWLDKEISQVIGQLGQRNREVDLLYQVWRQDGVEQWILCHMVIQTSYEADFAFRLDLYNAALKGLFRREVLTLVILADLKPDWRPDEYHFELAGFISHRQFPVCKILDHLDSDWKNDRSLSVEVARAQIAALKTANDPDARFSVKTQLVRNLYTAGYTADNVREIFRLIDWMMHLRRDLDARFKAELIAFEKELQMSYVTSVERLAKEEGLEQGRAQGLEQGREQGLIQGRLRIADLLIRQLTQACGHLPEAIQQRIRQSSLEWLMDLGDSIFSLRSLDDLNQWLDRADR